MVVNWAAWLAASSLTRRVILRQGGQSDSNVLWKSLEHFPEPHLHTLPFNRFFRLFLLAFHRLCASADNMQWNIELNSSESKLGARSIAQPVNGVNHITQPVYDPDTVALARTGKRQVLERRFGFVSMTGFSCGLMCTWESMLVVFLLGLQNGGPGGLVCGFIVVWFGTTSVFITISELASMIPTASGQYHWVSALAGEDWKRFWSYVTGKYKVEFNVW